MWDDHDKWVEELREFLGDEISSLEDEDIMFVSNLAAQTVRGEVSLPEAMREIEKWKMAKLGMIGFLDQESFEMEIRINYPDLIDVTGGVKRNLLIAEEPGIADGIVQCFADPRFAEFDAETCMVAMQGKAWFNINGLDRTEHQALGWAISMAVKDADS